ncbi:MAG TPA: cyclic nucleotide-binding domain-containing protein, partial [Polyangiaceae bacterium]|nr:cyclic nucleotide-binding domain-containing protein [Polyangiaceae bacterium]
GDEGRAAVLQRGDGYRSDQAPEGAGGLRREALPDAERRAAMLATAALFAALPADVRGRVAARARPRDLAPHERVVVQGGGRDSLFLIVEGGVDVLSRGAGGDRHVARLGAGEVFGEWALLTASPRSATVRGGAEGALVLEIGGDDLRPLLAAHPGLLVALALIGAERRALPAPPALSSLSSLSSLALGAGLVGRVAGWLGWSGGAGPAVA